MLQLDPAARATLWERVSALIEAYSRDVTGMRVAPELDPGRIRTELEKLDFEAPVEAGVAVDFAASSLSKWQVHGAHPRYFGLFNPAPTTMGIAADTLVAAFNPQIAAWSHSPFAAEAEAFVIRSLAGKFGYNKQSADGVFTSGGMEANHTALLCALADRFPQFVEGGLRSLPSQPVFYTSAEAHHSLAKAARMCGLGAGSVRRVEVDSKLRLNPRLLGKAIREDRARGLTPFMIAATAGTTNAGAVDPLAECAALAREENLWFHTDAAWGGAAALVPELRSLLLGIEQSDSITFDAHKWLSVPMGAGIFLTRHPSILDRTFRVATAYMPKEAAGLDIVDPHLHSMQWSRRFIGLKVLLSLMVAGWSGYEAAIRHQTSMGDILRTRLRTAGWEILNDTPLPVVCFADSDDAERQQAIAMRVVNSGEAWISTTLIGAGRTVLRACITNYLTQPEDTEALVAALERARRGDPRAYAPDAMKQSVP